jgi:hypothetical protein
MALLLNGYLNYLGERLVEEVRTFEGAFYGKLEVVARSEHTRPTAPQPDEMGQHFLGTSRSAASFAEST